MIAPNTISIPWILKIRIIKIILSNLEVFSKFKRRVLILKNIFIGKIKFFNEVEIAAPVRKQQLFSEFAVLVISDAHSRLPLLAYFGFFCSTHRNHYYFSRRKLIMFQVETCFKIIFEDVSTLPRAILQSVDNFSSFKMDCYVH